MGQQLKAALLGLQRDDTLPLGNVNQIRAKDRERREQVHADRVQNAKRPDRTALPDEAGCDSMGAAKEFASPIESG